MRMSTTADSRPTEPRIRRITIVATIVFVLPALLVSARRQTSDSEAPTQRQTQIVPAESNSPVAHGEYLATHVAMCVQCHSGRDAQGNILESEKFKGAALPVHSPYPNKEWAVRTPALAGLPGFTDAQIITLLTEGHAGDRRSPRPPMPPFRMNKADAEAIVAFLRSR
jgi:mono/diheme cytochrome c family protein